jgi:predicted nucleic acid-binding protein
MSGRLTVAEITGDVVERATELRAHHGLRVPDAIHLATTIDQQAALFLTGDAGLSRCTDVRVEVLHA